MKDRILTYVTKRLKSISGNFITVWQRPIRANDVHLNSFVEIDAKVGIIIQGGITTDYNFTLETVRLYKKHYPYSCIIVSTWDDTPQYYRDKLCEEGVDIVITPKPVSIHGNGNLQIYSTQEGIRMAKQKGCDYICKTRTDQRIYATDVFPCLIKMLEKFPCGIKCNLKGRIVVLGSNTFRDRTYDVNDMFTFGYTDDIEKYWSCPASFDWNYNSINYNIDSNKLLTETYICAHFLASLGFNLKWTVEDSVFFYSKLFIIIDKQTLDLYFLKRFKEYFNKFYDSSEKLIEFSFRDWMALQ